MTVLNITAKKQVRIVFIISTLIFIVTRFILFTGFNGSDDLHYGMLAARMIKGKYNPFEPGDIFSGRILLIAWQALLYKAGGISVFTTCIGTIIAVIVSCFLTVYKLLPVKGAAVTLLACSLFYFNPALTESITGILPDAYIMLAGITLLLLVKQGVSGNLSLKKSVVINTSMGVLIAVSLFIKETLLVFLPFSILVQCIYARRNKIAGISSMLLSFGLMIILFGTIYYYCTGNAFLKFVQIRNSEYPNPCNFNNLSLKEIVARLTYGIVPDFIISGFYPLVFAIVILVTRFFQWRRFDVERDFEITCLILLLVISNYFPFSLHGYQPLCSSSRQFLFIMPLAVAVIVIFLERDIKKGNTTFLLLVLSLLVLITGITNTRDKWQWMIYAMLLIYFSAQFVLQQHSKMVNYLIFSAILFTSIFERIFFPKPGWFKEMQVLNKTLKTEYYYFANNDNLMHWKLLHR